MNWKKEWKKAYRDLEIPRAADVLPSKAELTGVQKTPANTQKAKRRIPLRQTAALAACLVLLAGIIPLGITAMRQTEPPVTPGTDVPGTEQLDPPKLLDGSLWLGDGTLLPHNGDASLIDAVFNTDEVAPFWVEKRLADAAAAAPEETYAVVILHHTTCVSVEAEAALAEARDALNNVRGELLSAIAAERGISQRKAEGFLWREDAYREAKNAYVAALRAVAEEWNEAKRTHLAGALSYLGTHGFTEIAGKDYLPYLTVTSGVSLMEVSGADLLALGHNAIGDGVEIFPADAIAGHYYFTSPDEWMTPEITDTGLSAELEDVIAQFPDEETYRVIVRLDFESPVSGIEEMHREALAIMGFSSEKELGNDSALWQKYHETYNDLVYGGPTQREIIYRLFPGDYEIELLSGTVSWSGEQSIEVEGAHFYAGTVIANLSESRIRELAASDGVLYITYAGGAVNYRVSELLQWLVD